MAKKKADPANGKIGDRSGILIPQPHGGALQRGNHGNVGGMGFAPSILREKLRGSFAHRMVVIEQVADGTPMQEIEVPVASILPHITCANCGEAQIELAEPSKAALLKMTIKASATPADRLRALDLMAKYGIGVTKELTVDAVRGRLESTIAIIRSTLPPEQATPLLDALAPVWRS